MNEVGKTHWDLQSLISLKEISYHILLLRFEFANIQNFVFLN